MDLTPAPLHGDIHPGPDDGKAWWAKTSDGVRIRIADWARDAATRGTVLMFPGRTEYVEKYGVIAHGFNERGFAMAAIDWRGQGLADRLSENARLGHVGTFADYQRDVATLVRVARARDLPRPWYLLAHSMGGCIGLRALIEDLPVSATAFTGPMWGIAMSRHKRPFAWALSRLMPRLGRAEGLPPGTRLDPYVLSDPFEANLLTTDIEMFDMMRDQLLAHGELSLGGPSFQWLREALDECRALRRLPSPSAPCVTYLGERERIVDVDAIHDRMARWPGGRLEMIRNGEHEVLMEAPDARARLLDHMTAHFAAATEIADAAQ
jgi:lysophospholipase